MVTTAVEAGNLELNLTVDIKLTTSNQGFLVCFQTSLWDSPVKIRKMLCTLPNNVPEIDKFPEKSEKVKFESLLGPPICQTKQPTPIYA